MRPYERLPPILSFLALKASLEHPNLGFPYVAKNRESPDFGELCSHTGKWDGVSCLGFMEENYGTVACPSLPTFQSSQI